MFFCAGSVLAPGTEQFGHAQESTPTLRTAAQIAWAKPLGTLPSRTLARATSATVRPRGRTMRTYKEPLSSSIRKDNLAFRWAAVNNSGIRRQSEVNRGAL
jgi:hypothetical protein